MSDQQLEQLGINVIRGLSMDGPQAANCGHPGTAMALAPLAHVLWTRVMKYDATAPDWPDRDRFILSCGHASVLLYSMLHLTGTDITIDDFKSFRQFGSKAAGHPEIHHAKGIETTTGPLGQGLGNAVGMALAERSMRARFGKDLFDHYTYVLCSDGDLEEGISHEAASLAGHQKLDRIIAIYDDNHISIDGPTELSYSDDAAKRFEAYGWHVESVGEIANDCDALEAAILRAKAVTDRPSMIVLRSHIGYPSPNLTDSEKSHGSPLGADEVRATKEIMGLPADQAFWVPDEVREMYTTAGRRGGEQRLAWEQRRKSYSGDVERLNASLEGRGIAGWHTKLPTWEAGEKIATRQAMAACVTSAAETVPGLVSGGADLTGNTGTQIKGATPIDHENPGAQLMHWGVREHGMGSAMVGMAHHGGVVPIGGTFFIFSDYMRPAVRLAAMSEAHVIFSWTHDSVGLGEDGPTHQPIEHLASLRAMPQLRMLRPADANETVHAFRIAIDSKDATAMILSRQNLPVLEGTADAFDGVSKGAYVLQDTDGQPDLVLIGTGSEVSLCVEAAKVLAQRNIKTRVVSMPSWGMFEKAGQEYQNQVLPVGVPTLSVEAGSTFGWTRWADASVGIDRYGASAPGEVALRELGINVDNVVRHAEELLGAGTTGGSR